MRRVGLEAELADQPHRLVLRRPDPLPADLDHLVGLLADGMVQRPPSDAVAGLEDDDIQPGGVEGARRRQAREAGADDDYVVIGHRRGVSAICEKSRSSVSGFAPSRTFYG